MGSTLVKDTRVVRVICIGFEEARKCVGVGLLALLLEGAECAGDFVMYELKFDTVGMEVGNRHRPSSPTLYKSPQKQNWQARLPHRSIRPYSVRTSGVFENNISFSAWGRW
jgi:hypothetical protein